MPLLAFFLVTVFLIGLAIGSFINVCVARLPYEKSILWPGSHCPLCRQAIRRRDNLPVLGFLLLRGRCRSCGARISWRYPLVELFTGLAFVGLFHLEMVLNVLDLPMLRPLRLQFLGLMPLEALVVFFHHAVLVGFLLTASLCDLEDMEIPLSITVTGTLVGLALSTLFPWPFPESVWFLRQVEIPGQKFPPFPGLHAWPVWYPLPHWLPPGSWRLGLATGLAGALAGMLMLRGVRFLFGLGRGIEGLGMGDADLMMMAGAFIGWQPVLLAFFVSVGPALVFAIAQLLTRGGQSLPFGPSLALGVLITILTWPALGPHFQLLFFEPTLLLFMGVGGGIALLVISFLLRLIRGTDDSPEGPSSTGNPSGPPQGPYGPPQDATNPSV
jgi:leader peptidase (prepilin peptidase)/N-methyltransferase